MLLTAESENNMKFQIKVNGQVIAERQSQHLAEQFVSSLTTEQQQKAVIVPVTEGGKQFLLG